jgi:hypothetical protein
MVPLVESHGASEAPSHPTGRLREEPNMNQSSEEPGSTGGPSRLERINHWIRVILGIVIVTVFIVGMIAYYFTYR